MVGSGGGLESSGGRFGDFPDGSQGETGGVGSGAERDLYRELHNTNMVRIMNT